MTKRLVQPHFPRRPIQQGVVLLVALIFLVLLTLLAIGASSGTLLQQRMVAATRNAQLATMSADTALRGAEWRLWSATAAAGGHFTCLSGSISSDGCVKYDPSSSLYAANGDVTLFRTGNNAWLSGIGITYKAADDSGYTSGHDTADLAQNPQYIVEDLGAVLPPGGSAHESGDTGPTYGGPGKVDLHTYRITARATGGSQNTVRVVQSIFDAQAPN